MKFLVLSIIAVASMMVIACGEEEAAPEPPPLPAPTQPPTPDVQATVAAGVEATVVAANLQATAEAQAAPTDTPVPPTNTPVPPTNTPVPPTSTPVPPTDTPAPPTSTPVPPTNTPEPEPTPEPPTSTPEPEPTEVPATSTPVPTVTNTPKPTLTPTPTPLPYGLTWDNPVPIGQRFLVENVDGLSLRVREGFVFWANEAWDHKEYGINYADSLNDEAPRGHEYLLINIQVNGHQSDAEAYAKAAASRLTVQASPADNANAVERRLYPEGRVYQWGGSNHCGGQADTVLPRDFSLERWQGPDNGVRGFICFIVTHNHSGRVVLVDNGGPGAPPEDRRYFSLRR